MGHWSCAGSVAVAERAPGAPDPERAALRAMTKGVRLEECLAGRRVGGALAEQPTIMDVKRPSGRDRNCTSRRVDDRRTGADGEGTFEFG